MTRATANRRAAATPEPAAFALLQGAAHQAGLRRRLIEGTAGAMELKLWEFVYGYRADPQSTDMAQAIQFYTYGELGTTDPGVTATDRTTDAGPKAGAPASATSRAGGTPTRANAGNPVSGRRSETRPTIRELAQALLEDPEYLEALERRLADGKAPAIEAFLWQLAVDRESGAHGTPQPKPPLIFLSRHPIGEPQWDPLAKKAMAPQAPTVTPPSAPEEPSDSLLPDNLIRADEREIAAWDPWNPRG